MPKSTIDAAPIIQATETIEEETDREGEEEAAEEEKAADVVSATN